MTDRPKFWSSLFRKQPIEPGVYDPVEADNEEVMRAFDAAAGDMRAAMTAFLDDLERRQRARRIKNAAPHSR